MTSTPADEPRSFAPDELDWGDLRRVEPVTRSFGFDRGRPIDRYYIEGFLARHAGDVHGRVLEFGDDRYTRDFGGSAVAASDVLYPVEGNPHATLVADLADGGSLPTAAFDCVLCIQTLQYVFPLAAAVATLHRILRPGGVVLVSAPCLSQISPFDMEEWGEYWRFTSKSLQRLFSSDFPAAGLSVEAHGNVLAATAFLQGLAAEDLSPHELDTHDSEYPVTITLRAVRV